MHRIDGPGATVDNEFTDGDPVGGVPATIVTAPWLNDMQEELMSILSAAGIAPVKGTQDQVLKALKVVMGLNSGGVRGPSRNLKMSAGGTNAVVSITDDEVVVESAAGLLQTLRNVSVSINLATNGLNGLDTGSMAANTWYATYVIWNPTTGAKGGIASLSYAGPLMPSGYTHWAFVESVRVGATVTRILPFLKLGTDTMFVPTAGTDIPADFPVLVNGGTATTFTAVSLQGFIPPNAKSAQIGLNCAGTTAGRAEVYAGSTGTNSGLLAQAMTNGTSGPRIQFNVIEPFIKGIYYAVVSPGSASIFAFGWRS